MIAKSTPEILRPSVAIRGSRTGLVLGLGQPCTENRWQDNTCHTKPLGCDKSYCRYLFSQTQRGTNGSILFEFQFASTLTSCHSSHRTIAFKRDNVIYFSADVWFLMTKNIIIKLDSQDLLRGTENTIFEVLSRLHLHVTFQARHLCRKLHRK